MSWSWLLNIPGFPYDIDEHVAEYEFARSPKALEAYRYYFLYYDDETPWERIVAKALGIPFDDYEAGLHNRNSWNKVVKDAMKGKFPNNSSQAFKKILISKKMFNRANFKNFNRNLSRKPSSQRKNIIRQRIKLLNNLEGFGKDLNNSRVLYTTHNLTPQVLIKSLLTSNKVKSADKRKYINAYTGNLSFNTIESFRLTPDNTLRLLLAQNKNVSENLLKKVMNSTMNNTIKIATIEKYISKTGLTPDLVKKILKSNNVSTAIKKKYLNAYTGNLSLEIIQNFKLNSENTLKLLNDKRIDKKNLLKNVMNSKMNKKVKLGFIKKTMNNNGMNKTLFALKKINKLDVNLKDPVTYNQGNQVLMNNMIINNAGKLKIREAWAKSVLNDWTKNLHPMTGAPGWRKTTKSARTTNFGLVRNMPNKPTGKRAIRATPKTKTTSRRKSK